MQLDRLALVDGKDELERPVHLVGQVQPALSDTQVSLDLPDLALLDHQECQVFQVPQDLQGLQVSRIVIARQHAMHADRDIVPFSLCVWRMILCQRKCIGQRHANFRRDVIKADGSRSST